MIFITRTSGATETMSIESFRRGLITIASAFFALGVSTGYMLCKYL